MFCVHQPWDKLNTCVVGRSYPPEFYSFIKNPRLRSLFEKIAIETEEDLSFLAKTLKNFGVDIVRPNVPNVQLDQYLTSHRRIPGPISMTPRDQMIMLGHQFFLFPYDMTAVKCSGRVLPEHEDSTELARVTASIDWWSPILEVVEKQGNPVIEKKHQQALGSIPANGITKIGRDIYFGSATGIKLSPELELFSKEYLSEFRCHYVETGGHIDGCFSPVIPGLILSIREINCFESTFPDWEVVYLPNESWNKMRPFIDLKDKNQGRWWIKGHEYDTELIDYVETWLRDWTGYAEETVFDVNILSVDPHNVIVSSYNKTVFDALQRYNITAHICPMRHRYFWDGGIHCATLDLDRQGSMKDFFPQRG